MGTGLTIFLMLVLVFTAVIEAIFSKITEEEKKAIKKELDELTEAMTLYYRRFFVMENQYEAKNLSAFETYITNNDCSAFYLNDLLSSFSPQTAFIEICERLLSFFRCLSETQFTDQVSVFLLKYDKSLRQWEQIASAPTRLSEEDLEQVVRSNLFSDALKTTNPIIKRKAASGANYAPETREKDANPLDGSIIYQKIVLKKKSDVLQKYVLVISSYGEDAHFFYPDKNERMLKEVVLFVVRKVKIYATIDHVL